MQLESLEGQVIGVDGRYTLHGLLGSGGYGAVYEGWDRIIERRVAIKLLHAKGSAVEERFNREAKLQAKLETATSQVVRVYDIGAQSFYDRRIPYIVMEFIEGATLHDMVLGGEEGGAPLSPAHVTMIVYKLLQVLELADEYKIVHRDIKPANIMLTRTSKGEERVILLDFGVSGIQLEDSEDPYEDSKLTQSGDVIGTRRYMAPECQMDENGFAPNYKPSHVTDLYALGLTAYVLLTGKEPFELYAANALPVFYHFYREGRYEWPHVAITGHETLCKVINRLMAFAPEQRYESATDAMEALLPALQAARSEHHTPLVLPLPKVPLDIQGLEQTEVAPRSPTPQVRQKNFQSIAPLGDLEMTRALQQMMAARAGMPTPTASVAAEDSDADTTPADRPSRRPDRNKVATQQVQEPGARRAAPPLDRRLLAGVVGSVALLLCVVALVLGSNSAPTQPDDVASRQVSQPAPSPAPAAAAAAASAQAPAIAPAPVPAEELQTQGMKAAQGQLVLALVSARLAAELFASELPSRVDAAPKSGSKPVRAVARPSSTKSISSSTPPKQDTKQVEVKQPEAKQPEVKQAEAKQPEGPEKPKRKIQLPIRPEGFLHEN